MLMQPVDSSISLIHPSVAENEPFGPDDSSALGLMQAIEYCRAEPQDLWYFCVRVLGTAEFSSTLAHRLDRVANLEFWK